MSDKANVAPARRVAHEVLMRVARDHAFADRALDATLTRSLLEPRDRGLATELVYGTLREQRYLDFLLSQVATQPLDKLPLPVRVALRVGVYQRVATRVPGYSAVNEAVELVAHAAPRLKGFANAVLRELVRKRDAKALPDPVRELGDLAEGLAVRSSHPEWLVRELLKTLGQDGTQAWLEADNVAAPLALRVNVRRAKADDVAKRLSDRGIAVTRLDELPNVLLVSGAGSPGDMPELMNGDVTVQDPAAQLVTLLATPKPGEVVLDACAAPGGKSTHLAELMDDQGTIVAVDLHPAKVRLIDQAAQRLGLTSIHARPADATDTQALAAFLTSFAGRDTADRIVLDAPCSGLGTLRRNPELRDREESTVRELAALQDRLLDSCAARLAPGGVLVYSVCTPTAAEGPGRIEAFLARHPDFSLDVPPVPARFVTEKVVRTFTHLHAMDSFFAARLSRNAK